MPNTQFQAVDANGKPLSGGLVYTYAAGTTTPLPSYTDSTGSTQNPNPVVLDTAGRASIWLAQAAYKIVVEDADGVVQWSQDNVAGGNFVTNLPTVAQVAAAFSGADCGAKINAADDALGSTAGEIWVNQACGTSWTTGVTLSSNHVLRFVQGGTYQSSASPVITAASGSSVYGDQQWSNVLSSSNLTGDVIATAASAEGVRVADIQLTTSGTHTAGACLNISGALDAMIDHVLFTSCYNGILANNVNTHTVTQSKWVNTKNIGVIVTGAAAGEMQYTNDIMYTDGVAPQSVAGFQIQQAGGINFQTVDIIRSGVALQINPGSGQQVDWLFANGLQADSGSGDGIQIAPTGTGVVKGLVFSNSWSSTNGANGVNIGGNSSATIDDVRFVGMRFYNNANFGLIVNNTSAKNVQVNDSTAAGNSTAGAGTFAGICFQAGVSYFTVTNSRSGAAAGFSATQDYGIQIVTGAGDFYIVTGNNNQGNTIAPIQNNGTGTHTAVANNL